MSGPDDLQRKLAALASADARFGAYGRIISERGVPGPIEAMLTEIGETVLAQDLTFHFGATGSVTLIVSGQRVLAVRDVQGLVMPGIAEQLVGKPISASADGTQRVLMALLMQIDLLPETVETSSADGAPFAAPPGTGLSAEKLAGLLGVTYPVTPPTIFDRFRAALDPAPAACLVIPAGGEAVRTGDADSLARLEATVSALGLPASGENEPAKLSIFGQQSGGAPFIGAISGRSGSILWTIEEPHIVASVAAFHNLFPSS